MLHEYEMQYPVTMQISRSRLFMKLIANKVKQDDVISESCELIKKHILQNAHKFKNQEKHGHATELQD